MEALLSKQVEERALEQESSSLQDMVRFYCKLLAEGRIRACFEIGESTKKVKKQSSPFVKKRV